MIVANKPPSGLRVFLAAAVKQRLFVTPVNGRSSELVYSAVENWDGLPLYAEDELRRYLGNDSDIGEVGFRGKV